MRWITAARSDLAAANDLYTHGHYHQCAFHAQQAAEKSLKGLLRLLGHVPWGHSCSDLLSQVEEMLPNQVFPGLTAAVERLDSHYIPSRYPDAFPSGVPADHYNEGEAQQALDDAQAIIALAKNNLP